MSKLPSELTSEPKAQLLDAPVGLPTSSEDKELVLAFKRGDDGAYQEIYERHRVKVTNLCRRMLSNPDDAAEATQETFLRVYQALARFNGRYQLGPWITRIATNVCLDMLRARSRRPKGVMSLDAVDEEIIGHQGGDTPESLLMRGADGDSIRCTLDSLPPVHRVAIVLRDYEGLSYADIATAMQMTEVQVKALLHRARKGFKRSWLSSVSLLAPVRWFRVRRLGAIKDQAQAVSTPMADLMTSTGHVISSCSVALQSCGHVVGERLAAGLVTVGMAAVATGASIAGHVPPPPERIERTESQTSEVELLSASKDESGPEHVPTSKARSVTTADRTEDPAPEPPEVVPTPEPSPTPSATPTPAPSSSSTPPAGGGDKPKEGTVGGGTTPVAAPFTPVLRFNRQGASTTGSIPASHSAVVDCTKVGLQQKLSGQIHDFDGSLPARLALEVGTNASLELVVSKGDREFTYRGGAGQVQSSLSGSRLTLSFLGSYGFVGNDPQSANLPQYGRFRGEVTLDCAALSVVTQSLVFETG